MRTRPLLFLLLFAGCGEVKEESGVIPQDGDGDGYFGPEFGGLDCDDANAEAFPGALEVCDGFDNDCDAEVDEYAADATGWYLDADLDGYGDPALSWFSCEVREGYVGNALDCDDTRPQVNPDGAETCNSLDDDCDGETDEEASDALPWYADGDGDGWGSSETTLSCTQPSGTSDTPGDCDDGDATVHPDAEERCNSTDDDCDGTTDEDPTDARTWHPDMDDDGYGGATTSVTSCIPPTDHVEDGSDCDDTSAAVHPGATEVCNGEDDDCDGSEDEDAVDMGTWWQDKDGDGWGLDGTEVVSCAGPDGYARKGGDCDDENSRAHPGATETCDNDVDEDCDGYDAACAEEPME